MTDTPTPRRILTTAEMAAADARTIAAGTPGSELMERAGAAVAEAVAARWSPRPAAVLCGPGNNGGDGWVVARRLADRGWPVRLATLVPRERLGGDAAVAAARWDGEVELLTDTTVDGAGLVVDALFGAGLARPLEGPGRRALERAAARTPIAAVDLPSGLSGDTGAVLRQAQDEGSGYAPRAALTVTFQALKPAHVLQPGRELCGEIVAADIGVDLGDGMLWENGPALWADAWPWPETDTHKYARGALMVVSGGLDATGAARLAARAGLRVGAGLATVLCPPGALIVLAGALEAVMVRAFADAPQLAQRAERASAVVIGPGAGVGERTATNVRALAALGAPLVLDADALTSFREDPAALFALTTPLDVMTPHPGEFERVFPGLLAASPQRIAAARAAAERAGSVVLLKGADTVIAAPDGRAAVNVNAAPWLATAGSGDVLAGIIGGLLAQGMSAFEAACAGAWLHGEAGRGFGPGLIAEDLPDRLPPLLAALWAER